MDVCTQWSTQPNNTHGNLHTCKLPQHWQSMTQVVQQLVLIQSVGTAGLRHTASCVQRHRGWVMRNPADKVLSAFTVSQAGKQYTDCESPNPLEAASTVTNLKHARRFLLACFSMRCQVVTNNCHQSTGQVTSGHRTLPSRHCETHLLAGLENVLFVHGWAVAPHCEPQGTSGSHISCKACTYVCAVCKVPAFMT